MGKALGRWVRPSSPFDNPPRISPDGSKIALTRYGAENTDIWVHSSLSRDVTQEAYAFEARPPTSHPSGRPMERSLYLARPAADTSTCIK